MKPGGPVARVYCISPAALSLAGDIGTADSHRHKDMESARDHR